MTTVRPVPAFTGARVVEPVDVGLVQYEVAKVGWYTVGWDDDYLYRGAPGMSVHVTYGRWDGTGYPHLRDWPDRPVLFGIDVSGAAVVNVEKAIAIHDDDVTVGLRWTSRVACRRYNPDRPGGGGSVTPGAEEWNARIVCALVADFTRRDDADATLLAHQRHKAPDRLAAASRDIETCAAEVEHWQARLARARAVADRQVALMADEPAPAYPAPMRKASDWHAATDAGRSFLRCTDQPREVAIPA